MCTHRTHMDNEAAVTELPDKKWSQGHSHSEVKPHVITLPYCGYTRNLALRLLEVSSLQSRVWFAQAEQSRGEP